MSSAFSPDQSGTAALRDLVEMAGAMIVSRQNVSPKRLHEPGPTPAQVELMLNAAASAPDHGIITPWRFVIVPPEKRGLLGDAFAAALTDRDPAATAEQIASASEKAHRAPFLMLAIARLGPDEADVPDLERMLSLGCAVQNVLLMAHAMGFGAGLTSGQAMRSSRLRTLFNLAGGEQPVCCINVGTVEKSKPARVRPAPATFTTTL